MKGFPKNNTKLNPQAAQQRIMRLAHQKEPEVCQTCNGTHFFSVQTLSRLSSLEVGSPKDIIVPINQHFRCITCYTPWGEVLDGKETESRESGRKRQKGGNDPSNQDGGTPISGG